MGPRRCYGVCETLRTSFPGKRLHYGLCSQGDETGAPVKQSSLQKGDLSLSPNPYLSILKGGNLFVLEDRISFIIIKLVRTKLPIIK